MKHILKWFCFLWIGMMVFSVAGLANVAAAATLLTGHSEADAGQTAVQVNVDLGSAGGEDVAGFLLDLHFDQRLNLTGVQAGPALSAADKAVATNSLGAGAVRILVYGLNQNIIGNGQVLELKFDVAAEAGAGKADITLGQLSGTNPTGGSVSLDTQAGYIEIAGIVASIPPQPPQNLKVMDSTP